MKQTPLTHLHRNLGARIVEYAGYEMPVEYTGVTQEHLAVRNGAGIFDVSHMGEFWVKGPGALDLLQYITTNNVASLAIGQAQYSCFPNGQGGIVDDLIVYRYDTKKYMLVVNASNIDKDWNWINRHNSFGAVLENASDKMALIALQGPDSISILQPFVKSNLLELQSFHFRTETLTDMGEVMISATGYTGSGGFEIYCYNVGAPILWDAIMKQGRNFRVMPAGLAARDTLRLEMGYCLYGNDIDDTTSPIEAGLGWIVKLKEKGEFIDRKRIEQQIKGGVKRKLVGLELMERGIPRKGYTVFNSLEKSIGEITSGTMSPILNKGIGMAYLDVNESQTGNEVWVQIRNKYLKARVVKFPFIKKK